MNSFFQVQPSRKATKEQVSADTNLQPWVEKYRPKTIEDVSAQEHIVAVLEKTLTSTNLPHMLFYGPPGTGKTSTILALSRQLFGPDNFRSRVLELNASDERGIAIVREKIKNFARQTPRAQAVSSDGKAYPCPPYKIIILDEADSMTQDAQAALRRIMETYAHITRFCLVCNYVTRIIEPLASRCSKFRFKPLDDSSSTNRLEHIALSEQLRVKPDVFSALISTSGGDLRRAITYLQSAARLSAASETETTISPRDIQEIAGVVPDAVINNFARSLGIEVVNTEEGEEMDVDMDADQSTKLKGFDLIRNKVRAMMREGYSASQVLTQLHDIIILHQNLTARQKSKCALVMAEADKALCDGSDEELWVLEVALKVNKAVS
ncbi:P-loop containing nucleoside triphosphate hydrolase protein [Stereum hirsutum FP-91666 SS1]|uniref:P-loop containing nucleoside triphosphate hydrolase protein n=1 Tax=Stereum hirsutum (strain FP-91666) TaxID=721885 RepID=UPI000440E42D|nr:P-loop containing nucleoside triphosphate hydrolase protein [Stereum hirsutum FP-91666 SS1]EIM90431.1 P-loop containing nucleoside triphosphate hydrolase protein [Stereum hirsutum FP-91666 SS1]